MTDSQPKFDDDHMDKFFDNLLPEDEYREYLAEMQTDEVFQAEQLLQSKIDQSLKNLFKFSPLENEIGGSAVTQTPLDHQSKLAKTFDRSQFVKLALAASLTGVAAWGIWRYLPSSNTNTFFQPVPLAKIYNETVERGFKPYYECHDMQRFANTFEHRQGVPLGLLPMPEDRQMTGLSYLGGLSRSSTAMLCTVRGRNVLVFVDKISSDPQEIATTNNDPALNVFRVAKNGLVFYEVTPLGKSTMIEYFDFQN